MKKNDLGIPENNHMDVNYYSALGKILVNFQLLETAINNLCHCLLTLPKKHSDVILSEMSFKNKTHLLSVIGKDVICDTDSYGKEKNMVQLKFLINEISKCEIFRNKIIHSEWNPYLKIQIKVTAKIKKGLHKEYLMPKFEELENKATLISNLASELNSFSETIAIKLDRPHGLIMLRDKMSFHQPLKGIQDYYFKDSPKKID